MITIFSFCTWFCWVPFFTLDGVPSFSLTLGPGNWVSADKISSGINSLCKDVGRGLVLSISEWLALRFGKPQLLSSRAGEEMYQFQWYWKYLTYKCLPLSPRMQTYIASVDYEIFLDDNTEKEKPLTIIFMYTCTRCILLQQNFSFRQWLLSVTLSTDLVFHFFNTTVNMEKNQNQ